LKIYFCFCWQSYKIIEKYSYLCQQKGV